MKGRQEFPIFTDLFPFLKLMEDEIGVNSILGLPLFAFAIAFSAKMQACGPEARALRAKSIGGKRIRSGDPPVLPQTEAGLSGTRPGVPTSQLLYP